MERKRRYIMAENRGLDYMQNLLKNTLVSLGEVVILDEDGRMVFIGEEYARNMGVSMEDAIGKYITDVVEDSELPGVLKSGKPKKGAIYCRNGKTSWINRVPITDGDKVIGVIGLSAITDDVDAQELRNKLGFVVRELNYYKEKYQTMSTPTFNIDGIVSRSRVMEELKEALQMVAQRRSTVLLTGESGTGKEVFANALHNLSERKGKPFVRINCAAIPDNLLESELFGYEEGAFTGAVKGGKIGDFEAANGGTLFLDEVNSLSPNMQAKLLRVLQEREVKKIGSTKPVPVDVRFIFATNKELYKMVQEGSFREDFYYRINVINLQLPPLRERPEDIEPLVENFVQKFNKRFDMEIAGVEPTAMLLLENYAWPGNVRELENCIERAFNYSNGKILRARDIRLPGMEIHGLDAAEPGALLTLKEARSQAEKMAIQRTLEACDGNKTEAAKLLDIDRSILYDKIKRYGL